MRSSSWPSSPASSSGLADCSAARARTTSSGTCTALNGGRDSAAECGAAAARTVADCGAAFAHELAQAPGQHDSECWYDKELMHPRLVLKLDQLSLHDLPLLRLLTYAASPVHSLHSNVRHAPGDCCCTAAELAAPCPPPAHCRLVPPSWPWPLTGSRSLRSSRRRITEAHHRFKGQDQGRTLFGNRLLRCGSVPASTCCPSAQHAKRR